MRADWVEPGFRDIWIDMFYLLSDCAYSHAARITSLFRRARDTQKQIGAPEDKLRVIPNGIRDEVFSNIPEKEPGDEIGIGAIVRIARIKDIETMLFAFLETVMEYPTAHLYIMGDVDDQDYYESCVNIVEQLNLSDSVTFTGSASVAEYLLKYDFTVLTSLSEGQPLSILESLCAARPVVATDVGACMELLLGGEIAPNGDILDPDGFGEAGIIAPSTDVQQIADGMKELCGNVGRRQRMGRNGRQRVRAIYSQELSIGRYRDLYDEVMALPGL